jgi:hypothetical protein
MVRVQWPGAAMVRHLNCVLELRRSQAAQAARVINQLEEEANSSENNMGIVICNLQAASGWRAVRLAHAGAQSTLELDGKSLVAMWAHTM